MNLKFDLLMECVSLDNLECTMLKFLPILIRTYLERFWALDK